MEVYSWWQERSEGNAFEEVRRIHRRDHENVEIQNLGDTNAADTRQEMASQLLAGEPPATFLANAGAHLLGWTVVETQLHPPNHVLEDRVESARWITPLSGLFARRDLREHLRGELWEHLVARTDGEEVPYAVPINIHRLNVVYYNSATLTEFPDLETLCPTGDYDPWSDEHDLGFEIAVGAGARKEQAFTIVLLALENVLPAIAGRTVVDGRTRTPQEVATFYDQLLRGAEPGPRDENDASVDVRAAFECVQYLSQFFRRDEDNFTFPEDDGWAEAVYHVKEGRSAATVMGDWANGVLADVLDDSVKSVPFPGTEGLFVYTSDTFPLPIGTEHPREAEALLETIASPEAQIAFSKEKGSIPALKGHDESLHPWQIAAGRAFDDGPRLLANSGYFHTYYPQTELQAAIVAMTAWNVVSPPADGEDREARLRERKRLRDAALRAFTDAEPLLARWQGRLAQGAANPIDP